MITFLLVAHKKHQIGIESHGVKRWILRDINLLPENSFHSKGQRNEEWSFFLDGWKLTFFFNGHIYIYILVSGVATTLYSVVLCVFFLQLMKYRPELGVNCISVAVYRDILLYKFYENHITWSNYSDLTRPHPKWLFSTGNPLISGWNIVPFGQIISRIKTSLIFLLRFVESSLSPKIIVR